MNEKDRTIAAARNPPNIMELWLFLVILVIIQYHIRSIPDLARALTLFHYLQQINEPYKRYMNCTKIFSARNSLRYIKTPSIYLTCLQWFQLWTWSSNELHYRQWLIEAYFFNTHRMEYEVFALLFPVTFKLTFSQFSLLGCLFILVESLQSWVLFSSIFEARVKEVLYQQSITMSKATRRSCSMCIVEFTYWDLEVWRWEDVTNDRNMLESVRNSEFSCL